VTRNVFFFLMSSGARASFYYACQESPAGAEIRQKHMLPCANMRAASGPIAFHSISGGLIMRVTMEIASFAVLRSCECPADSNVVDCVP
jgi:hypothetical protein